MKPSIDQVKEMRSCTGLPLKDIMKIFNQSKDFSEAMGMTQRDEIDASERQQEKQAKVRILVAQLSEN